ncbi:hypothetical protein TorRG33x02_320330 [Trema orientale]|uniref:Uncharacterized protein n=1 Tax=Trema orientale TaxID=63057 RepID=A0A2P5BI88_TREOI|nr:hypothetical protein TorRG33x02_320330 [Trema orientale]
MLKRSPRVRKKKVERKWMERCTSIYIPDDLLHNIMTCHSDFTATFMDHVHRSKNLSMTDSTSTWTLLGMCKDLLLIKISNSYYFYKPLTEQLSMLPDPPTMKGKLAMSGVVLEANNNNKQLGSGSSSTRYRVMLMIFLRSNNNNESTSQRTIMF